MRCKDDGRKKALRTLLLFDENGTPISTDKDLLRGSSRKDFNGLCGSSKVIGISPIKFPHKSFSLGQVRKKHLLPNAENAFLLENNLFRR